MDFTISPKPLSEVSIAAIASQRYTGQPIHPKPTVSFVNNQGTVALDETSDFVYHYGSNTAVGNAAGSVTIEAVSQKPQRKPNY